MFSKLKTVLVELSTAQGTVFSGRADAVELLTTDGTIAITPHDESYLNLTHATEINIRVGTKFSRFALTNAAASLREGRLSVLAEEIHAAELPASSGAGDI